MDGRNTLTKGYANRSAQKFQPMDSLVICNRGSATVKAPRLIVNSTGNWYSNETLLAEILADAASDREKALALWSFFVYNRDHYQSPVSGCHISNPLKCLTNFGYLSCGPMSLALTSAAELAGFDYIHWVLSFSGLTHHVPELFIDDDFAVIDVDAEVFYLDYDNQNLVGHKQLLNDHYLIYRTRHLGKSRPCRGSQEFARFYNDQNYSLIPPGCVYASMDYRLRPGESLRFDWTCRDRLLHMQDNPPEPYPWFIRNSRFSYRPPFDRCPFDALFNSSLNTVLAVDSLGKAFLSTDSAAMCLTLEINSPFVILDSRLLLDLHRLAPQGSVRLQYSFHGDYWYPFLLPALPDSGFCSLDIDLTHLFDMRLALKYYLKIHLDSPALRLYDIRVDSRIQMTTRFMPELELGENKLYYTDSSVCRNLEVNVYWRECDTNSPPDAVHSPLFPKHGTAVDGSVFTFRWTPAQDPDGDRITDYEFILSERPDMRYPLSPTFNAYTSVQDSGLCQFHIPVPGLLNHEQTYFWRVRAVDEQGNWGKWSDTWEFTPHTVMVPRNVCLFEYQDRMLLCWQPDSGGLIPDHYLIFADSIPHGFTPGPENCIAVTQSTELQLQNNTLLYYRVAAVSLSGKQGGPSPVAHRFSNVEYENSSESHVLVNYPNPFNKSTAILLSVPQTGRVLVRIYNLLGQKISTLCDCVMKSGLHTLIWNGEDDKGAAAGTGLYICQVRMQGNSCSCSMMLVR